MGELSSVKCSVQINFLNSTNHTGREVALRSKMSSGAGVLVSQAMQIQMAGNDTWPSDVQLYQPFEVEQILINDNASCLAVQAFLHMARLDFAVEMRANAEHMSPTKTSLHQSEQFC